MVHSKTIFPVTKSKQIQHKANVTTKKTKTTPSRAQKSEYTPTTPDNTITHRDQPIIRQEEKLPDNQKHLSTKAILQKSQSMRHQNPSSHRKLAWPLITHIDQDYVRLDQQCIYELIYLICSEETIMVKKQPISYHISEVEINYMTVDM